MRSLVAAESTFHWLSTAARAPGAHYNITLVTGAKDLSGTTMTAAFTFGFDTAAGGETDPPMVNLPEPDDGATGVKRDVTIKVTFSEPMDKATVKAAFSIPKPAAANTGTMTWNAAGTAMSFVPQSPLGYGDTVSFSVSAAAKDLAGNALTPPVTRTFTVIKQDTATLLISAAQSGSVNGCGNPILQQIEVGECVKAPDPMHPSPQYSAERGFLTYDLGPLASATTINSALLYAYQTFTNGDPFGRLGGKINVEHVNYGATLDLADYGTVALATCLGSPPTCWVVPPLSTDTTGGWKSTTVTGFVRDDFTNRVVRANRSQFRLRFPIDTLQPVLTVIGTVDFDTANNLSYLKVTYEHP